MSGSRSNNAWRIVRRFVMACCVALVLPATAHAASPSSDVDAAWRDLSIHELHHTAWTVRQGAPGQVTALAQSRDGFLWLATQSGLFRFDGIRFERIAPRGPEAFPTESVAALYAPRGGGVWVGLRYGIASFVAEDGSVRHYGEADGLPTGSVYGFAEDADGTLWAATYQGLARFDGTHWHTLDASWAVPGKQARSVFVDRDGVVWVATESALAYLAPGTQAFMAIPTAVGRISQIAQAPDGAIWIAEADGGVRAVWHAGSADVVRPQLPHASAGLLFDRHGTLWATSLGEGIRRIVSPTSTHGDTPAVQRFGEDDGLTSDYLWPAIEDREGNVWFGTSRGLDRFRRSNVVPVAMPDGSYDFSIAAGDAGSLWVGTKNRPLLRLRRDEAPQTFAPRGITSALHARDHGLVLAGPDGLWRAGDPPTLLAPLPAQVNYSGVQAMAQASDGALWLSLNQPGVFVWRAGAWSQHVDPAFPTGSSPLVLLADNDAMWLGFARNQLVWLAPDGAVRFDAGTGLDVGNVTALARGRDVLWIGGEHGLAWHDGERIHTAAPRDDDLLSGVTGILETDDGELWLNGSRGVLRIVPAQLQVLRDGGSRVMPAAVADIDVFDVLDGMPGTPAQFRPLPTAVQGSDGRLWFATTSGVVWIDPHRILRNPLPPPVTVRRIFVDGQPADTANPLQLASGSTRLEIDYTALSLVVPERVRFRYRLEGFEAGWQSVGNRRSAVYTHPGPGKYVFHVQASNDDGVWNETGATLAFSVAPRFYQTTWFALVCALAVVALLRMFYRRRVRQLSAGLRARMQERHDERERIARELHDTLLQGFQGLILRLQGVADRLRGDDPLRRDMERALDRAEEVLVEGRDRVFELRSADTASLDLLDALRDVCASVAGDAPTRHRVGVLGRPEALDPLVQEEVICIVREAVTNAFRHAQARLVDVEISYTRRALRVSVRDDGQGIDADVLDRGGRPGHWGLPGMRERAARIGAQVEIVSKAGVGTDVIVQLPGSLAFRRKRRTWWQRLGLARRG